MCWMCENNKKAQPSTWMGRMYKVFAFQDGALLGSGYVIVDDRSGSHEPVLTDLQGNHLAINGMFEVRIADGNPQLVLVSGRTH
jgi:hypothetical protein